MQINRKVFLEDKKAAHERNQEHEDEINQPVVEPLVFIVGVKGYQKQRNHQIDLVDVADEKSNNDPKGNQNPFLLDFDLIENFYHRPQ